MCHCVRLNAKLCADIQAPTSLPQPPRRPQRQLLQKPTAPPRLRMTRLRRRLPRPRSRASCRAPSLTWPTLSRPRSPAVRCASHAAVFARVLGLASSQPSCRAPRHGRVCRGRHRQRRAAHLLLSTLVASQLCGGNAAAMTERQLYKGGLLKNASASLAEHGGGPEMQSTDCLLLTACPMR